MSSLYCNQGPGAVTTGNMDPGFRAQAGNGCQTSPPIAVAERDPLLRSCPDAYSSACDESGGLSDTYHFHPLLVPIKCRKSRTSKPSTEAQARSGDMGFPSQPLNVKVKAEVESPTRAPITETQAQPLEQPAPKTRSRKKKVDVEGDATGGRGKGRGRGVSGRGRGGCGTAALVKSEIVVKPDPESNLPSMFELGTVPAQEKTPGGGANDLYNSSAVSPPSTAGGAMAEEALACGGGMVRRAPVEDAPPSQWDRNDPKSNKEAGSGPISANAASSGNPETGRFNRENPPDARGSASYTCAVPQVAPPNLDALAPAPLPLHQPNSVRGRGSEAEASRPFAETVGNVSAAAAASAAAAVSFSSKEAVPVDAYATDHPNLPRAASGEGGGVSQPTNHPSFGGGLNNNMGAAPIMANPPHQTTWPNVVSNSGEDPGGARGALDSVSGAGHAPSPPTIGPIGPVATAPAPAPGPSPAPSPPLASSSPQEAGGQPPSTCAEAPDPSIGSSTGRSTPPPPSSANASAAPSQHDSSGSTLDPNPPKFSTVTSHGNGEVKGGDGVGKGGISGGSLDGPGLTGGVGGSDNGGGAAVVKGDLGGGGVGGTVGRGNRDSVRVKSVLPPMSPRSRHNLSRLLTQRPPAPPMSRAACCAICFAGEASLSTKPAPVSSTRRLSVTWQGEIEIMSEHGTTSTISTCMHSMTLSPLLSPTPPHPLRLAPLSDAEEALALQSAQQSGGKLAAPAPTFIRPLPPSFRLLQGTRITGLPRPPELKPMDPLPNGTPWSVWDRFFEETLLPSGDMSNEVGLINFHPSARQSEAANWIQNYVDVWRRRRCVYSSAQRFSDPSFRLRYTFYYVPSDCPWAIDRLVPSLPPSLQHMALDGTLVFVLLLRKVEFNNLPESSRAAGRAPLSPPLGHALPPSATSHRSPYPAPSPTPYTSSAPVAPSAPYTFAFASHAPASSAAVSPFDSIEHPDNISHPPLSPSPYSGSLASTSAGPPPMPRALPSASDTVASLGDYPPPSHSAPSHKLHEPAWKRLASRMKAEMTSAGPIQDPSSSQDLYAAAPPAPVQLAPCQRFRSWKDYVKLVNDGVPLDFFSSDNPPDVQKAYRSLTRVEPPYQTTARTAMR